MGVKTSATPRLLPKLFVLFLKIKKYSQSLQITQLSNYCWNGSSENIFAQISVIKRNYKKKTSFSNFTSESSLKVFQSFLELFRKANFEIEPFFNKKLKSNWQCNTYKVVSQASDPIELGKEPPRLFFGRTLKKALKKREGLFYFFWLHGCYSWYIAYSRAWYAIPRARIGGIWEIPTYFDGPLKTSCLQEKILQYIHYVLKCKGYIQFESEITFFLTPIVGWITNTCSKQTQDEKSTKAKK